jgi:hypothetical protein
MPPLKPMVSLYKELKALNWSIAVISERVEGERNVTIRNLRNAGYVDYILILRFVLCCTLMASLIVLCAFLLLDSYVRSFWCLLCN